MKRSHCLLTILVLVSSTFALSDDQRDRSPLVGIVARVKLGDEKEADRLNERLHFCVFDDGDDDYIYVGTKYGMWSEGEFELSINDKRIFTGKVPHLVYRGAIIRMGNIFNEQPKSNIGIHITRIRGIFK